MVMAKLAGPRMAVRKVPVQLVGDRESQSARAKEAGGGGTSPLATLVKRERCRRPGIEMPRSRPGRKAHSRGEWEGEAL